MPLMRLLFIFMILIGTQTLFSQNANTSRFRDTKADTLQKQIQTLIILGVGSTATQFFLDNLEEKMIKAFKGEHVDVEYRYLGKTVAEARQDTSLNYAHNFEAVLLFIPSDTSYFDIYDHYGYIPVPIPPYGSIGGRTVVSTNVNYEQEFEVRLYTKEPQHKLIWSALLKVDGLMSKKIYSSIAKSFISRFKKHKYIK